MTRWAPRQRQFRRSNAPVANKDVVQDIRPPALRASDTAVDTMLYRNWLSGVLGSSDSVTAQKYGLALYQARTWTWGEADDIRQHPELRAQKIEQKSQQWMKVAEQIRTEDPEAYEYLRASKEWNGLAPASSR